MRRSKSYCIFTTRSIQEGVKDKCTKIIRSLFICYTVELSSIVQPILGDRSPNVLNHGTTKWLVLRTFDNERKLIKCYLADGSAWTRCGELTVLPRPLAGFEGPLRSKGGDGRQKQGIKKRGREGEEVEKGGEQEGTGGKEEREEERRGKRMAPHLLHPSFASDFRTKCGIFCLKKLQLFFESSNPEMPPDFIQRLLSFDLHSHNALKSVKLDLDWLARCY